MLNIATIRCLRPINVIQCRCKDQSMKPLAFIPNGVVSAMFSVIGSWLITIKRDVINLDSAAPKWRNPLLETFWKWTGLYWWASSFLFLCSSLAFPSTFPLHSPAPCYSDDQTPWRGPAICDCSCSWSGPENCTVHTKGTMASDLESMITVIGHREGTDIVFWCKDSTCFWQIAITRSMVPERSRLRAFLLPPPWFRWWTF